MGILRFSKKIFLITTKKELDEIGQIISTKTEEKPLMAEVKATSTNEFYKALANNLRISEEVVIQLSEYNDEEMVKVDDKVLHVIRTIKKPKEQKVVLVLGEKIGDGL